MHDETLTRTTNVREVFPARATMNGTAFNWTDLQQLNAGSWFLQVRPPPPRGVAGLLHSCGCCDLKALALRCPAEGSALLH